jgi:hypothetical protein
MGTHNILVCIHLIMLILITRMVAVEWKRHQQQFHFVVVDQVVAVVYQVLVAAHTWMLPQTMRTQWQAYCLCKCLLSATAGARCVVQLQQMMVVVQAEVILTQLLPLLMQLQHMHTP